MRPARIRMRPAHKQTNMGQTSNIPACDWSAYWYTAVFSSKEVYTARAAQTKVGKFIGWILGLCCCCCTAAAAAATSTALLLLVVPTAAASIEAEFASLSAYLKIRPGRFDEWMDAVSRVCAVVPFKRGATGCCWVGGCSTNTLGRFDSSWFVVFLLLVEGRLGDDEGCSGAWNNQRQEQVVVSRVRKEVSPP